MSANSALPPVTDDHRHRAFEILGLRDCTYEMAMADSLKRRVIECCATGLRTMDWERTQERTVEHVRRVKLGVDGHPIGWRTQVAPGPMAPITQPPLF